MLRQENHLNLGGRGCTFGEAEVGGSSSRQSGVQDQPSQDGETLSLLKIQILARRSGVCIRNDNLMLEKQGAPGLNWLEGLLLLRCSVAVALVLDLTLQHRLKCSGTITAHCRLDLLSSIFKNQKFGKRFERFCSVEGKNKIKLILVIRINKNRPGWWLMPVILALWEAIVGRLLESRSSRPAWTTW
ncbi:hypothetical protein AAY473_034397 [Plecturocebus cupreus]